MPHICESLKVPKSLPSRLSLLVPGLIHPHSECSSQTSELPGISDVKQGLNLFSSHFNESPTGLNALAWSGMIIKRRLLKRKTRGLVFCLPVEALVLSRTCCIMDEQECVSHRRREPPALRTRPVMKYSVCGECWWIQLCVLSRLFIRWGYNYTQRHFKAY